MAGSHYVYVLFRQTGEPFYVGLGQGDRWLEHERTVKRGRSYKDNILAAMKDAGLEVPKVKVREGLSKAQAVEIEIALIAAIGRYPDGPLTNLTRGGEGVFGMSPEDRERHRRNTSAAMMGRVVKPETREAIGAAQRGKPRRKHTDEEREKIAAAGRERWGNPETHARLILTAGMVGKRHSPETIDKMRKAAAGRVNSDEARRKMSATRTGRKLSPETRAKMSEAQKRRHARG